MQPVIASLQSGDSDFMTRRFAAIPRLYMILCFTPHCYYYMTRGDNYLVSHGEDLQRTAFSLLRTETVPVSLFLVGPGG